MKAKESGNISISQIYHHFNIPDHQHHYNGTSISKGSCIAVYVALPYKTIWN